MLALTPDQVLQLSFPFQVDQACSPQSGHSQELQTGSGESGFCTPAQTIAFCVSKTDTPRRLSSDCKLHLCAVGAHWSICCGLLAAVSTFNG